MTVTRRRRSTRDSETLSGNGSRHIRHRSGVSFRVVSLRGWPAHDAAVERLRSSYAAIPAGAPVRLAKKTSNLFRPRAATDGARVWTSPGSTA